MCCNQRLLPKDILLNGCLNECLSRKELQPLLSLITTPQLQLFRSLFTFG